MSPGPDDRGPADEEFEDAEYSEEAPRSVFSTTWFRAILVVVVLAVVGVIALPYLLDWVGPSKVTPTVKGAVVNVPSPPRPQSGQPIGGPAAPASSAPASTPVVAPAPGAPAVGLETAQAPAARPPEAKAESPTPAARAVAPAAARKGKEAVAPAESAATEVAKSAKVSAPAKSKATHAAKAAPARRPAQKEAAVAATGPYWVQVGAFHEEGRAKALVARLRAENFAAEEVAPAGEAAEPAAKEEAAPAPLTPGDTYDVFVSGASSEDVNAKLAGKGLSADSVAGGAVIKPSLSLRDAVSLSKDLATEGMKVQVRRASPAAPVEKPVAPAAAPGGGLYRVRVGSFPDRAAAEAARKALTAKGYGGLFLVRGGE